MKTEPEIVAFDGAADPALQLFLPEKSRITFHYNNRRVSRVDQKKAYRDGLESARVA